MLDPDIETEDALALLSIDDVDDEKPGPGGWTRRKFLAAVGAGAFGGAAIGTVADDLLGGMPEAWAAPPIGANDGVMVIVTLYGGLDGMNAVVPYTNGTYYTRRPGLAIPADTVLPLNSDYGLVPQLAVMKQMYDQGKVGVVQGVGYANPDLSHFTSMAIWMRGWMGGGGPVTGWIGRWLDGLGAEKGNTAGAALSSSVALHLQGQERRAVGIPPDGNMFGSSTNAAEQRMYNTLRSLAAPAQRGPWHDSHTDVLKTQLDLAQKVAPTFTGTPPGGGEFRRKLTIAARLVNADIGLRVLDVSGGGFDTHENQSQFLPNRLADLDAGIAAFFNELNPVFRDRVTIVIFSEFGRTIGSNASAGTDHGTANPMFVIGDKVKGGLYGQHQSLTQLGPGGRAIATVDFRWVYGSLIDGWLGGGGSSVLGNNFPNLGLFNSGPGPLPPPPPPAPVVVTPPPVTPPPSTDPEVEPELPPVFDRTLPAGFVPAPEQKRIIDTRDGTGGRFTPMNDNETWTLQLAGKYGIPQDATAVFLNITTVNPTKSTYLTVWSGDGPRPLASSATLTPNEVKASLVITKLSAIGRANLFNNMGATHVVIDLVGWFHTSSDLGVHSASPRRLVDTRDSNAPLTPGAPLSVPTRGFAGVPEGAAAIAVNVTATEVTAPSYLTVWPGKGPAPATSNLNMKTDDTVPNLVMTRLTEDGWLSVGTNAGSTHVVLDVVATFVHGVSGRLVALDPYRVLDTREKMGVLSTWSEGPIPMNVLGKGGVPSEGVIAVLLTVHVVEPTAPSFVTVYPWSPKRPFTSNLNVKAGGVNSNLVIAQIGNDGSVAVRNNTGNAQLIADVVGYITA